MYEKKFSKWRLWDRRDELRGVDHPGIYAIALSNRDITDEVFEWMKGIIYVGMTVSGLKGRLDQFNNTIKGRGGHGGAFRVVYKYRNYNKLKKKLYVSVAPFKFDPTSEKPADLRKKGDVVRFEYLCLAQYAERFRRQPEFNDKKRSPKE
ncbi:MAG: hypothetical protein HY204_11750 [Nitrospirae bacterium]|nr:hypothetical protein [Nitrospirota bacterium]